MSEKEESKSPERAMAEIAPTLHVGKSGITTQLLEELTRQLEKRKVVKVRLLRSARQSMDTEQAARQLAEGTGGRVVDIRGGCIVLKRQ
ncbi:YhbY family RNA-binding protein [Methermicoccus shengliensis]|nr:YhbY family RNA-binding protein [Methermicoccus shengliensis]KUK04301.1 MAG: RNA-binding protein [Euryarchaeota archaeon 55_53]KUK30644.1 MAG: RNA-binding protein [Methanosarcinales archeaon 56_1174]MDI3488193.1 RNA-binding protein [Methanosarcinales archaeon]MDN5295468.1 RNA-binding protein [Methanosarcinales archaeon]